MTAASHNCCVTDKRTLETESDAAMQHLKKIGGLKTMNTGGWANNSWVRPSAGYLYTAKERGQIQAPWLTLGSLTISTY